MKKILETQFIGDELYQNGFPITNVFILNGGVYTKPLFSNGTAVFNWDYV